MGNRRPSAYSIPPAGRVSALRQRMIDDMTVRNLAPNTMLCYLKGPLPRPIFSQVPRAVNPGRHSRISTLFGPGQEGVREQPVSGHDRAAVSLRGHSAAGALHRNAPHAAEGTLSAGDP